MQGLMRAASGRDAGGLRAGSIGSGTHSVSSLGVRAARKWVLDPMATALGRG